MGGKGEGTGNGVPPCPPLKYIVAENFNAVSQIIRRTEQCELPM